MDIGTISLILLIGIFVLLAIGMPLGFASGERGRTLPEREVAQAAIDHQLAHLRELGMKIEKLGRLLEGELQHLSDIFIFPGDVGEVRAVARAAAIFSGQIGVRHESHLEFYPAGARRPPGQVAAGAAAGGEHRSAGTRPDLAHGGLDDAVRVDAEVLQLVDVRVVPDVAAGDDAPRAAAMLH